MRLKQHRLQSFVVGGIRQIVLSKIVLCDDLIVGIEDDYISPISSPTLPYLICFIVLNHGKGQVVRLEL